jgi:hypothetical protein
MILYEMFAGRLPFQGSFAELITAHLMTVPDPPSRHRPLPRALEQLIIRCIDKDPGQRPQSAEALGKALDASLPTADEHVQTAAVVVAGVPAGSVVAVPPAVADSGGPTPVAAPPAPAPPDTLAPPPGRTASDLTMQPTRSRRPLLWAGAAAAGALVAVTIALGARHGGGDRGALVTVVDAQPPPTTTTTARPRPGRAHVVIKGAEDARVMRVLRVLVDGRVVASGVREARVLDLAPGESHALRVEAVDRAPQDRSFTVAAGAEAELEVSLAPSLPPAVEPHPAAQHARRHDTPGARTGQPASPPPTPPASRTRHRDGLVGDDIFDGK